MPESNPRRRNRPSLVHQRTLAFARQRGRCVYCSVLMCQDDPIAYAKVFGISERQALELRCTGEHLHPYSEGGNSSTGNIVAACLRCNRLRHCRPKVPSAREFQILVRERIGRRRWHDSWVFERVFSKVGFAPINALELAQFPRTAIQTKRLSQLATSLGAGSTVPRG